MFIGQSTATSDEDKVRYSHLQINLGQILRIEEKAVKEQIHNGVVAPARTLKRSTKVRTTTVCIKYYAVVPVEDPVTLGEALESSDREFWRQEIKEKIVFIEDNEKWTKTELLPRKRDTI